MEKFLIVSGVILIAVGVLWPWVGNIPLGQLPGDIVINRPGLKVYFPVTTMLVVSLALSLLFHLFK